MNPKPMFVWRDVHGSIVADVVQVISGGRLKYVARVAGDQVEKDHFSCASRAIGAWLSQRGIRATVGAP